MKLPYKYIDWSGNGTKHFSIVIFKECVFAYYYHNTFGWFRFFGYGFMWKHLSNHSLTFSQRIGKKGYVVIKGWCISYLERK